MTQRAVAGITATLLSSFALAQPLPAVAPAKAGFSAWAVADFKGKPLQLYQRTITR